MDHCKHLFIFCLLSLSLPFTGSAQFEDLFKNPEKIKDSEFAEKPDANEAAQSNASAEVEVPKLRLLSPEPHRNPLSGMDVSPDRRYVLTYSPKVLKIWDVEQRVAIATFSSDNERYPIRFARFAADSQAVWLMKDPRHLERHTLDFGESSRLPTWNMPSSRLRLDGQRSQLVGISYNGKHNRLSIERVDLATEERTKLFEGIDLAAHGVPASGESLQMTDFTIDAKAQFATLRFNAKLPTLLLNLETETVEASIPWAKGVVGLLPDGRLLSHGYGGGTNTYSIFNAVTHGLETLFEHASTQVLRPTLPEKAGDPITLKAADTLIFFDLESRVKTQNLAIAGRLTNTARSAWIKGQKRYLLGQISRDPATLSLESVYLTTINPATQTYGRDWSIQTFWPQSIVARSDDFQFLAVSGQRARQVTLTEAGLMAEDLNVESKKLRYLIPAYDQPAQQWALVSRTGDIILQPDAETAAYETGPILKGRTREALRKAPYTFRFDSTPDGNKMARYHQFAVTVTDLITHTVIREIEVPSSYAFNEGNQQRVALSPDGATVAFAYTQKSDAGPVDFVECYDVLNGQLKWKQTADRPFQKIDALRFSNDGRMLYLIGPAGQASGTHAFTSRFVATGELNRNYKGWSSSQVAYNRSGSLATLLLGKNVTVITLPEGSKVARLELDFAPSSLSFIGSDSFLIAHSDLDATIRLIDIREGAVVADMKLFEDPAQWLVSHPDTGLFAAEPSVQQELKFIQGEAILPLEAYFQELYEPRLLGSLVRGLTPKPAIPIADLKTAPKLSLRIDGPATRGLTVEDEFETFELPSSEVTLAVEATSVGSPVNDLRIYHNGKLVEGATRGLFVEDDDTLDEPEVFERALKRTFELTPGKNRFRAVAINAQGTESVPDEVIVYAKGSEAPDTSEGIALHMLFVGIDAYENPEYNLNYARKDAEAVMGALEASYGALFSRKNVLSLFDADATRANILASLEAIQAEAEPRDVFIFYYAGHGVVSTDESAEFFLAPHESRQLYGEARQLRDVGVGSAELLAYSREIAAQKQLFLLDACQSAGALKNIAVRGAAEEKAIAQLARSTGTHWLTATGSEQFAAEFETLGHGAFTYTLLKALGGGADTGDGVISVNELKAYIEAQVPEVTALHKGEAQYPASYGYGQDFPITVPQGLR